MKTEEMFEAGWSEAQVDCRRMFEENRQTMWVLESLELVDVNQAALLNIPQPGPRLVSA